MVLRMSKHLLLLLCLTASAAAEPVSFSREVLPLLSDNCLSCHGQDEGHRKADLRLDTQEGAREVLKSGDFIDRITTDDPEEVMPPPKSHKPKLKAEQVALLKRWIAEGAGLGEALVSRKAGQSEGRRPSGGFFRESPSREGRPEAVSEGSRAHAAAQALV
jgi:hypothetical protein